MKKLLLFITIAMLLVSCPSMTEEDKLKEKQKVYYLDEDFILIDAKEDVAGGDNGNAYKVRTWVIARVIKNHPDTVLQGEIISKVATNMKDDCNCGSQDFLITNELWYGKPIGSKLHFDFIRKDRFFKVPATKVPIVEEPPTPVEPTVVDTSGDKMQIELNILKLERELTLLKEELKKYN